MAATQQALAHSEAKAKAASDDLTAACANQAELAQWVAEKRHLRTHLQQHRMQEQTHCHQVMIVDALAATLHDASATMRVQWLQRDVFELWKWR
jgi:hypothetical protein